jgi:hypothetical protein
MHPNSEWALWVHSAAPLGRHVRPASPSYSWSFITMNSSRSPLSRYKGGQTLITPLSSSFPSQQTVEGQRRRSGSAPGQRCQGGCARASVHTPVDGRLSYQSSYGFASGQIPRCSQGTLLPSSGEPKVSNPWNNVQRKDSI